MLFEVLEAGRENGWWLVAGGCESGAAERPAMPDRKGFRIHADRPRHPWRGRFALRA
ncbi:hypothetical protein ACOMYX_18245 [Pantoea agglomerans]